MSLKYINNKFTRILYKVVEKMKILVLLMKLGHFRKDIKVIIKS